MGCTTVLDVTHLTLSSQPKSTRPKRSGSLASANNNRHQRLGNTKEVQCQPSRVLPLYAAYSKTSITRESQQLSLPIPTNYNFNFPHSLLSAQHKSSCQIISSINCNRQIICAEASRADMRRIHTAGICQPGQSHGVWVVERPALGLGVNRSTLQIKRHKVSVAVWPFQQVRLLWIWRFRR